MLAKVSDYLDVSSNQRMCNSIGLETINYETCKTTSWMYNRMYWWLVSPSADCGTSEFIVGNDINFSISSARNFRNVRHAVYLSFSISLSGT